MRRTHVLFVVLGIFVVADLVLIDHWLLEASLRDDSGRPIREAFVLARFYGQGPLIAIPTPPDPQSRHQFCMGGQVTKTDASGNFAFSMWTRNRFLVRKHAQLVVFKPGFEALAGTTAISSSIFALPRIEKLTIASAAGRTSDPNWTNEVRARIPPLELTYSEALYAATVVVTASMSGCSEDGFPLAVEAMNYVTNTAATLEERDRARGACGFARKKIESGKNEFQNLSWPFDCDNLPFKHQPSSQVLAVEAELAAKRKAAAEHSSSEGGSSSAFKSPQE